MEVKDIMIAIQIDEYEYLIKEINSLHEQSLAFVQNYIDELNNLVVPEGGFHADMISKKVELLVKALQSRILPELENSFSKMENEIMILGERMAECDESGRIKVQWEK